MSDGFGPMVYTLVIGGIARKIKGAKLWTGHKEDWRPSVSTVKTIRYVKKRSSIRRRLGLGLGVRVRRVRVMRNVDSDTFVYVENK